MLSAQRRVDGQQQSLVPARKGSFCADALHPSAPLSQRPKPPSVLPTGALSGSSCTVRKVDSVQCRHLSLR
jgi:hypothetical protein